MPDPVPKPCWVSVPSGLRETGLDEIRSRGTIARDLELLAALSDPAKTVYVDGPSVRVTPLRRS